MLALVLVAAVVVIASFTVRPTRARAFSLFYGSTFLNDERGPVSVDLTNAAPTVRLLDADAQVGASSPADLDVVPLTGATAAARPDPPAHSTWSTRPASW